MELTEGERLIIAILLEVAPLCDADPQLDALSSDRFAEIWTNTMGHRVILREPVECV